ncbi:hypothetical protein [Caedibacter taeniospiralis]|jgi:hypothetical protein|uniref:hypothetical protein n=1 Tax=Caedibacter taeniospiralis TaxID=28907 RepID=UPI0037C075D3
MTQLVQQAQALQHWQYIQPIAIIPKNEREYKKLVSYLDELLDIYVDQEDHPVWSLIHSLRAMESVTRGRVDPGSLALLISKRRAEGARAKSVKQL